MIRGKGNALEGEGNPGKVNKKVKKAVFLETRVKKKSTFIKETALLYLWRKIIVLRHWVKYLNSFIPLILYDLLCIVDQGKSNTYKHEPKKELNIDVKL